VSALARRTGIPEQALVEWDRIPSAQVQVHAGKVIMRGSKRRFV
jgi:hypothetical protein